MPCDERYRAWAMRREPQGAARPSPELLRAKLTHVSPCRARASFRELHFYVGGRAWSWCFPGAAGPGEHVAPAEAGTLILRPGPHGLRAEAARSVIPDGTNANGQGGIWTQAVPLDLGAAADLAIDGLPVFVHCSLLGRRHG
jgi:hypothetical protein